MANANRRPPIGARSTGAVPQRAVHHAHRRGAGKQPRPGFGGRTRPTPAVLRWPRMDGVAPGRTPTRRPRARNVGREDIRVIPGSHPGRRCPMTCIFALWALLGSNQRPLPCKAKSAGCKTAGRRGNDLPHQPKRSSTFLTGCRWFLAFHGLRRPGDGRPEGDLPGPTKWVAQQICLAEGSTTAARSEC